MLFDTHAHMDDQAFADDREALLKSFPQQGVGLVMNPGCSLASSRASSKALSSMWAWVSNNMFIPP